MQDLSDLSIEEARDILDRAGVGSKLKDIPSGRIVEITGFDNEGDPITSVGPRYARSFVLLEPANPLGRDHKKGTNDGRDICIYCNAPTKSIGLVPASSMKICTKCGR